MVEGKQEKEEGLRVWEKVVRSWQRKHGQNRGSTVVLRSTGWSCQNTGKFFFLGKSGTILPGGMVRLCQTTSWHGWVLQLFYGVFGLCFGWGLCLSYFGDSL